MSGPLRVLDAVMQDLIVCVGKAIEQGYCVAFVGRAEWEEWWTEESNDRQSRMDMMVTYEPLAELGRQNFFCDDENIIVLWQVTG